MIGLYVHVPFCVHKCIYCDFPSYGGVSHYIEDYVQALCREIDGFTGTDQADTVYFGGGTPSLLPTQHIQCILDHLRRKFFILDNAEITVEANPDSMDAVYAAALASIGVNRISLGIQSFSDDMLAFLGRIHSAAAGVKAVRAVQDAGIDNVSIDLMYGLPGQTLEMAAYDMEMLSGLSVTHASIYHLIVEEHTPLFYGVQQKKILLPADESNEAMEGNIHAAMHAMGFQHYEISSYARPGYVSRHNCKYWKYVPYIGFGVSAHSFYEDRRWSNIANIPAYIGRAGRECVIHEVITIDRMRAMEDYCFLALRMRKGIVYSDFARRFSCSIESEFGTILNQLLNRKLLENTYQGCCMTDLGLSYGNYVFSQFLR
ncbi:coproporphyrinogen III oxidase [Megasphaera cerevisiae DSM 20462]|jgi:oxygen-independent coproporphyrinogen-3 oxidase|uniref:Heme chaperone HemW n=1 Tax=Megasphaera cerevisiae DSM 20462 TaxID=1122219 RepID=A0A0J6ZMN2_9FIRM|nr:radical SAM family heme chaperone HemW [Megasphaera cerevisiae]KMO86156.1 coproporphyrinogen III oxidase [Megasphaera cerevisiae DSM 20462]MCI1749993.1 radical SAM family heme chaperone HemW [Megasphaera cerevisiae]OKY52825.1 coproporphyrinogen III oxidase [Megasphaera cerevisiae]SJZ39925.1 oxygen-independent coproporphyrinogen-3 oxidase [Megasphaera cerevisiae DSM 20462]